MYKTSPPNPSSEQRNVRVCRCIEWRVTWDHISGTRSVRSKRDFKHESSARQFAQRLIHMSASVSGNRSTSLGAEHHGGGHENCK